MEQLRQVFAELHTATIRDTVSLHMAWGLFDAEGVFVEPGRHEQAATAMLDDLAWWATALRTARDAAATPPTVFAEVGS